jgi:hypothetical protein
MKTSILNDTIFAVEDSEINIRKFINELNKKYENDYKQYLIEHLEQIAPESLQWHAKFYVPVGRNDVN